MSQTEQFNRLLQIIFSFTGIVIAAAALLAVVVAVRTPPFRWLLLAVTMFAGSLGADTREIGPGIERVPLITPLNELQTLGRPITFLLLVLCAAVVVTASPGSPPPTPPAVQLFLLVQGVLVLKMITSGMVTYGLFSVVIYGLWFVVFWRGVGGWLRTSGDLLWALRCVGLALALFSGANVVQAVTDPTPLLVNGVGRFSGTTANPQFAAVLLGLGVPATTYLVWNRDIGLREQVAWGVILLAQAGLIVWTGSRTGALMAVCSLCLVLRRRLALAAVAGLFIAAGVWWVAGEFTDSLNPEFLLRTEDTRSHMWEGLWVSFMNYPLFGAPPDANTERLGFAENSWLSMAGACGLIGLVPLVAFGLVVAGKVTEVMRPTAVGRGRVLVADVLPACCFALLVGSIFEAFLLGVVNFPIPFIYLCLALLHSAPSPRVARTAVLPPSSNPRRV